VRLNNLQFFNARQHCGKRQTSRVLNRICIRWDPASNISPHTDYSEAAATATQMPESYSILGGDHVTVVATVAGLRARRSGVWISEQQQIFLLSKAWGPPKLLFKGYWRSVPEVKRPGHEVHHSPYQVPMLRMSRAVPPTPPACLHGVDRDNLHFFSFTIYLSS